MQHGTYKVNGVKVPSVTTILNNRKDPGGLIHWAWQCGVDGKDYRQVRDAAADAGTVAHDMVEAWLQGQEFTAEVPEHIGKKAQQGFDSFLEWWNGRGLELVASEVEMVSEVHLFGGRLDAVGRVGGQFTLLDWKTSSGLYPDHLMQIAAYRMLWEESHTDQKISRVNLLRFGKEGADFHDHGYAAEQLDEAGEAFLLLRRVYDVDKSLKKMLR